MQKTGKLVDFRGFRATGTRVMYKLENKPLYQCIFARALIWYRGLLDECVEFVSIFEICRLQRKNFSNKIQETSEARRALLRVIRG